MSEKELTDCRRDVVQAHKEWKGAIAAGDQQLAESLDKQCRDLRARILFAKRSISRT